MIKSIGRHAMAATAVLAIGGAGIVSAPRPAHASTFSAAYTRTVPVLGARSVVITGSLTASPDRVATGQPIRFQLHIARLSLQSPVPIDSWTAIAGIDVNGAQTTSFRMAGTGGPLGPRQPVSGDLYGSWTPRGPGVDRLRGGTVVISAKVARVGVLTASCQPITPRPVLETVSVLSVRRPLHARYLNLPDA
jgi:hypothetical protein